MEEEIKAYHLAVEHWEQAQIEQTQKFESVDMAAYYTSLERFQTELATYQLSIQVWDREWSNYTENEDLFYRLTCIY